VVSSPREKKSVLTLGDTRLTHDCQGYSRRDFLRVGALGSAGLSLAGLVQARAEAADGSSVLSDRSVVLLFLHGGPPHIEFFDPKTTAPPEIRCITGEVQTKLPGITFGATFPKLAALADKIAVVRSYGSGNADHKYGSIVSGGDPNGASISSIYARVRGNNHALTGLPTNVHVLPEAVQDGLKFDSNFETAALPTVTQSGTLGPTFTAFNPSGGGDLKKDMEMRLSAERLTDRRELLRGLDNMRRHADVVKVADSLSYYQQQAFEVITRGVADAFDISKESPQTVARYDTSGLFRMEDLTRWYDMRRVSNQLGRQMLLARRLCEAGCGFVTVSDCGWDYHANGNSPKRMAGIYPMGGQVDHAVSAFIEDVIDRGLENRILLIVTGEMGRSPRLNNSGGRDHYGELTPLLLFGGGLKTGQVIGQSDHHAALAQTEPYRPRHLVATVMHTLFDVGRLRLEQNVPREIVRLAEQSKPIDHVL
jgi:hypothetical protein